MKPFESVTYFLPIPTGEVEHLKHPSDSDRIIHSVPKVKRQPVSAIVTAVHEGELVDVLFVHPSRVSSLSSGDWYNALERAYGVRPEGHADLEDGDERLGYYEAIERVVSIPVALGGMVNFPEPGVYKVTVDGLASSPAPVVALGTSAGFSSADGIHVVPSAADLDAVAAEQKAAEDTSGQ